MLTKDIEMLKFLMDKGLNPRKENSSGKNALVFAKENFYPASAVAILRNYMRTLYCEEEFSHQTKKARVIENNKSEDDVQCGVCLEKKKHNDPILATISMCNHRFCIPCLATWSNQCTAGEAEHSSCPSCREIFRLFASLIANYF